MFQDLIHVFVCVKPRLHENFIAIPFTYTNAIVISAEYHDTISLSYPAWKHPESVRELFDLYR